MLEVIGCAVLIGVVISFYMSRKKQIDEVKNQIDDMIK